MPRHSRSAFTLIELLVVIAIIAILGVVVVLTLNPAELLRQSRDSNRVSDMDTLTHALSLYSTDVGTNFGSSSVVYVSIFDPTATSTAGDQCQGLGLPTLPAIYSYHCAASSSYRNVDGTGWIPVNFKAISAGTPFGNLPVDPTNNSSSRLYYTYTTNGTQYEVTSVMESSKYKLGGSNDVITGDGAPLASVYAKGTSLSLEPMDYGDSALLGYWGFEEGTNGIAYDYSGNNATGSWSGTQTGSSGYYSAGRIGSWAGTFNGTNDMVVGSSTGFPTGNAPRTVTLWVNISTTTAIGTGNLFNYGSWACTASTFGVGDQNDNVTFWGACDDLASGISIPLNQWVFIAIVYNGNTGITFYLNGTSATNTLTSALNTSSGSSFRIGEAGSGPSSYANGLIDDVRLYGRALSATEIQSIYNGGK